MRKCDGSNAVLLKQGRCAFSISVRSGEQQTHQSISKNAMATNAHRKGMCRAEFPAYTRFINSSSDQTDKQTNSMMHVVVVASIGRFHIGTLWPTFKYAVSAF